MKETKKIGGVPSRAIILPLEIILTALLILIAVLVYEVNRSSNDLTALVEASGVYQKEVTDLQAGINTLSETASSYIQAPVTGDGSANVGPLKAYAGELGRDRRGPQIAERFRDYTVSDEVRGHVNDAAAISETMLEIQLHAIALVRSVYPLPPIPELDAIPDVPLTEAELAMPEEARVGTAKQMMGAEYSQMKFNVAENVSASTRLLQESFSVAAVETGKHVAALRAALWGVIVAIVVTLAVAFTMLRFWIIKPLQQHAQEISSDEPMKNTSAAREMRVLVNAFNTLRGRRNRLEAILRSAAETDALTGLPNRYSMERAALEAGENGGAMAVLMFDVNYLKQINDAEGHLAGDRLLRTAGACIRECFAAEREDNCYRLGGDEFAAVLRDCSEEEIRQRLDRFALAQEREHISVSVGYGFASETDEDSFKTLLAEADKNMYDMKKQTHDAAGAGVPAR